MGVISVLLELQGMVFQILMWNLLSKGYSWSRTYGLASILLSNNALVSKLIICY